NPSGPSVNTTPLSASYIPILKASPADACYQLTVTLDPPNSGVINTRPAPNCGTKYAAGTDVVIKASNANGFAFGGWRGAAHGPDATTTFTMNADKNVIAIFATPATNDDPSTAFDLTTSLNRGINYSTREDTSNASNSRDDPLTCESGKGGKTVWF